MAEREARARDLVPGDRLLSLFDSVSTVEAVEPAGFSAISKWTGEPVPVLEVQLRSPQGELVLHFWNADRKLRARD